VSDYRHHSGCRLPTVVKELTNFHPPQWGISHHQHFDLRIWVNELKERKSVWIDSRAGSGRLHATFPMGR
jgi:hypothetical protein